MFSTTISRRALAVLLTLAATPLAAQAPADPLPIDPNVRIGTLDNGLRYYVRRNTRPENRAELRLAVNAGSILEEDDQLGLAHLVEHMAFNGTEDFEKQELIDYLEGIGMQFGPSINAYTSFDETVYMLQVPTENAAVVDTAFQILENWAHRVSFDPEEVDKERGVVIEEWRLGRGADARIFDQQLPVMLKDSRYAERLPIGKPEILRSVPHQRLIDFYRAWYRPDLMAVVAVGDFDPDAIERVIREKFGAIPASSSPADRPAYPVPDHAEPLYTIASDPEQTTSQVGVIVKLPPRRITTVGDLRQLLVERLATGMLNKRLAELVQQADPPYVGAGSGRGGFVRTKGMFQLAAGVNDGGIPRGLEALLTEAERAARHGFTATELEREKADLLRQLENAYNERDNRESALLANEYGANYLEGEPIPGVEFEYRTAQAVVPAITLDQVNAVARTNLAEENRVVLASGPAKEGVTLPTADELAGIFQQVAAADIAPYEDAAADVPLLAELPAPGRITAQRAMPELELIEWELSNGAIVWVKPTTFKMDEVHFRAVSPGGYSLAGDDAHVSAELAPTLIALSGIGEHDLIALQKELAGKRVQVQPTIAETTEGMAGMAAPADLETMLQLTHLYFTAPRRDDEALGSLRAQFGALLQNRSASPQTAFADTLAVTLAQHHPRARPPSMAMLEEIDLDAALSFYSDRFADAGDFHFVFVGAIDTASLRSLVERYLASLPTTGRQETFADLGIDPPTGVVEKTVLRGIEPKAQTRFVFTGDFDYTRENRLAMRMLAATLDIRLREILREDLGGTYGVAVAGTYDKHPDEEYAFIIDFGSDPGRADELGNVVLEELRRFQTEGPTADEVAKVTEQERRRLETSRQQNGWWATQLVFAADHDADPRNLLDDSLIDAITIESIRAAAQQWLRLDNYVMVRLLPERVSS